MRRRAFDLLEQVRYRELGRRGNQQMNMFAMPVDDVRRTALCPNNARHIGMDLGRKLRRQERFVVFRRKDDVQQDVGVRVRHKGCRAQGQS